MSCTVLSCVVLDMPVPSPLGPTFLGAKMCPKFSPLLPAGLLGTSLRASPFSQGSGEGKSLQARSILALIAPIPCVPTSPNEEEAPKPAPVCYLGLFKAKRRACHVMMVIHHISPSVKDRDAGTWGCLVPTPITEDRGLLD